jgi:uncharacterized double-CXXCG motif protein
MPYLVKNSAPSNSSADPYQIDGRGTFSLPGLTCPRCSSWGSSGLQYPTIDSKGLPFALQSAGRKGPWPISLEAWRLLWKEGTAWAPQGVVVNPGARFGPLSLKFSGNPLDFVWLQSFTPLIREPPFNVLRSEGLEIKGTPAQVRWSRGQSQPLIELEIHPHVQLAASQRAVSCPICGRLEQVAPKSILLDEASYDQSLPLQRIRELPTYIVASDAFCACIEKHKFTGISFAPLEFS